MDEQLLPIVLSFNYLLNALNSMTVQLICASKIYSIYEQWTKRKCNNVHAIISKQNSRLPKIISIIYVNMYKQQFADRYISITDTKLKIKIPISTHMIKHYDDVIMGAIASQITIITIIYWNVFSGADQSKHQSSAPLAFVWGIHRGPVNSQHKWPVTRKKFPFDDVIMCVMCFYR